MAYTVKQFYPFEEIKSESIDSLPLELPRAKEYLFNRELSLIEFFRRVLDESLDKTEPLLERLKFLAILSSNLDEFFMIRVSGLKEKYAGKISPDGMTPKEQLTEIRNQVSGLGKEQSRCLNEEILPELSNHGVSVGSYKSLSETERKNLDGYFQNKIYPILTPQAVDPSHPFPYISGGSLNLGLFVRPKVSRRIEKVLYKTSDEFFVRVKIPSSVPRLIPVEKDSTKFILAEDLIAANIQTLVSDSDSASCFAFRLTRDADVGLRETEAEDLLEMMEENLKQRRFGEVVRLEVSGKMPSEIVEYLTDSLEINAEDVYKIDGLLKITDLMTLYKLDSPDLKDEPLCVSQPAIFNSGESVFDLIKRQDILLHHPYMPYNIVTDFIKESVEDENVLAIKMCLYRTGANSPIPPLLIKAAESGKQVTVLVELKARFDEENNIEWAKKLERAGVHVVYGLLGLKTHCKTTLIVRREDDELRCYVHLATGNYNPETSAVYTDLGLLTDDDKIGADATKLFNFLTAYKQEDNFKKLLVAPINLRERMLEMIERETEHAKNGRFARIIAKFNRLADPKIIRALYEASNAGVKIDLIVRGVCLLRPGVKGMSENIRVRSIVGRLLEHSRVYYFANGGAEEIYLGSSDWMPRNLDRRVEVITPVEDEKLKHYLKDEFLMTYLRDNLKAAELQPDGTYKRVFPSANDKPFNSQLAFQERSNVVNFHSKH
ncbi:polyphosphate kinase 1 [soil metagenome]